MSMDSTEAPQMLEHVRKSLNFTPSDTKWIPCSARFVCAGVSTTAKGIINVYELSRGDINIATEIVRPCSGIKCCTFGASSLEERHIAYGGYGGKLEICDLERGQGEPIFSVNAHSSIVNAIDGIGGVQVGHGAPELVTGGRDGRVHVWDPRVQTAVFSLEPERGQSARDCWTVAFGNSYNDEERCICAGYDNGDVKLFDLRTSTLRWEGNCRNGVTNIEFDRKDIEMNKMVVTSLESRFKCYDLRTQHPDEGFAFVSERAHKSTVWLVKHLPQNRDIFMTGGGNGGLNIYKYHYPFKRAKTHSKDGAPVGVAGSVELLNSRVISTQPIVSFDWSPDREGLCCLSSIDQTLRVLIVTKLRKY